VDFANLFDDDNGSWLSRALKQNAIGGLRDYNVIAQQHKKSAYVVHNHKEKANSVPPRPFILSDRSSDNRISLMALRLIPLDFLLELRYLLPLIL
jgi:hypothetical protein